MSSTVRVQLQSGTNVLQHVRHTTATSPPAASIRTDHSHSLCVRIPYENPLPKTNAEPTHLSILEAYEKCDAESSQRGSVLIRQPAHVLRCAGTHPEMGMTKKSSLQQGLHEWTLPEPELHYHQGHHQRDSLAAA